MTAPIRDMAGLVEAMRVAKIERGISDITLEAIAGMCNGTVPKYIGPKPTKKLGPVSTFLMIGALGKALMLVDDAEQIARVEKRWQRRTVKGGATLQMRARQMAEQASRASIEQGEQEMLEFKAKMSLSERMKQLSKLGASKGGKRRAKIMGKRARQRQASHAARKRWAKQS